MFHVVCSTGKSSISIFIFPGGGRVQALPPNTNTKSTQTSDCTAMASLRSEQNVQFILLAEFDIDQGSVLSHQYPFPTGTDEQCGFPTMRSATRVTDSNHRQLAELMLPDGVHQRSEDWTIFLLNQSPVNSIATPFHESDEAVPETNGAKEDKKELLYVLNLVRTKHDQNVRR